MHADRTLLGAALALVIVAPTAPVSAWCQMTSSSRAADPGECILADNEETFPLAWRRRCTSISLSVEGSRDFTTEEVASIFEDAATTWEDVRCDGAPTGLDVQVLPDLNACTGGSHFTGEANVHTVVFVDEGWVAEREHDARAYAVTLVWHDRRSGEIWDVDMEINEEKGPYDICSPLGCAADTVDLPNVVTHEMGHYFGLAHTPDDSLATMWASAEPDETLKRDLREDDIAGLCAIYPPGSLPEACDPTPRGGLDLECIREGNGDGGCDCSAAGSRRGAQGAGLVGLAATAMLMLVRRRRARRND